MDNATPTRTRRSSSPKKSALKRSKPIAILVLGMHRSGTSALTRIINLLGADLPSNLMPAKHDNQTGFWESKALVQLHDELLQQLDSSWYSISSLSERWFQSPLAFEYCERIVDFLQQEFARSRLFVLKDPRMSRLLPIWLEALAMFGATPRIVVAIRNPLEVAKSLNARNELLTAWSMLLWLRYHLEAELHSRNQIRSFVTYDDLLNDWRTALNKIATELKFAWPRGTQNTFVEIERFLSTGQRHHTALNEVLLGRADISAWIKQAYEVLLQMVEQPNQITLQKRLDQLTQTLSDADLTFGMVVADQERILEHQELKIKHSEQTLADTRTDLDSKIIQLQQQITSRDQDIQNLHNNVTELNEKQKQRDSRIAELKKEVEQGDGRIAELEQGVKQRDGRIAELKKEVEQGDGRIVDLQEEVKQRDGRIVDQSLQLESAAQAQQQLLQTHQTETKDLNQRLVAANDATAAAHKSLQEISNKAKHLEKHSQQQYAQLLNLEEEKNRLIQSRQALIDSKSWKITAPLRTMQDGLRSTATVFSWVMAGKLRDAWREHKTHRLLNKSGLFNHCYYLRENPDVQKAGIEPLWHYIRHGVQEGRNPNVLFDTLWYLAQNPDVATAEINPLLHYFLHGAKENRDPGPTFNTAIYTQQHPELATSDINPLAHRLAQDVDETSQTDSITPQTQESLPQSLIPTVNTAGCLESIKGQIISGWAVNEDQPNKPALLMITINGRFIAQVLANGQRRDLAAKFSLASPLCGFNYELPPDITLAFSERAEITVRFAHNGCHLEKSPAQMQIGSMGKALESNVNNIGLCYQKRLLSPPSTSAVSSRKKIALIVLNRNGSQFLQDLFASFIQFNTYPRYEFIVVDHGSTDDSESVCRVWQDKLTLKLLSRGKNYSFSESNNFAALHTESELIVFLNNDIIFAQDILPGMAAYFDDSTVGMIGIRLLTPQSTVATAHGNGDLSVEHVQHLGVAFSSHRLDRPFLPFELSRNRYTQAIEHSVWDTPAVTAALSMMRRTDFLTVAGFDEGYFYGFEDVDLCLTVREHLDKKIICDNRLLAFHHRSASRQYHSSAEKALAARNQQLLNQRVGLHVLAKMRAEQISNQPIYRMVPLRVAFAISEVAIDTPRGDYFTAFELAKFLHSEYGWECYFVERENWYSDSDYDVLIAMVEGFDVTRLQRMPNDAVLIVWIRNWFDRWIVNPHLGQFDQIWVSSRKALHAFPAETDVPVKLIRIATNDEHFQPSDPHAELTSDYCFTGNYFNVARDIACCLEPEVIGYSFALYGHGWEAVPDLASWYRGARPYSDMSCIYASTRIVIDDANHTCKHWGAANSRVFDAIASGALVITNSRSVSDDVFGGLLPVYSTKEELTGLLKYYLADEDARSSLVKQLRQTVLEKHTYRQRAHEVHAVVTEALASERVSICLCSQDEVAEIAAGQIIEQLRQHGFRVFRRTDSKLGAHRYLGTEVCFWITTTAHLPKVDNLQAGKLNALFLLNTDGKLNSITAFDLIIVSEDVIIAPDSDNSETEIITLSVTDNGLLAGLKVQMEAITTAIRTRLKVRRRLSKSNSSIDPVVIKDRVQNQPNRTSLPAPNLVTPSVKLRFFPDYTSTNHYQRLLYAKLQDAIDIKPGSIDDCLTLLRADDIDKSPRSVIFHLHWTSVIVGITNEQAEAEKRIAAFLSKLDQVLALGGRVFWTIHNMLSHEAAFPKLEAQLCQALAERAEIIHIHSPRVPELVSEWYSLPQEKLLVARHGSYVGVFSDTIKRSKARNQLALPEEALVLLSLGQIRSYKGLNKLITAFEATQKEFPNTWLVLAGAPYRFDLESLQHRLKQLPNIVTQFKHIPDEELQIFLRAADYLVTPYSQVLTSGSVILGASFGLPVIAPAIGLLGETVVDGQTGILYDPVQPTGLADALRRAAQMNRADWQQMATQIKQGALINDWSESARLLGQRAVGGALGQQMTITTVADQKYECYVRQAEQNQPSVRVAVVVLHYACLEDTLRCLASLREQDYQSFDLYIVSNDDSPRAFDVFAQLYPAATIIQAPENIGYAGGNNLALSKIKNGGYDYFWLLNPDTQVPRNVLEGLVERADRNTDIGVFGVTITFGNKPDTVWFAGGNVNWSNGLETTHNYIGKDISTLPSKPIEADYITGAGLFARTTLLHDVGLLPEDYFLYFEETDWCLRAQRHSYRLVVFPELRMLHWKRSEQNQLPTDTYLYYFCRNKLLMCQRYHFDKLDETKKQLEKLADIWLERIRQRSPERVAVAENIVKSAIKDGLEGRSGRTYSPGN